MIKLYAIETPEGELLPSYDRGDEGIRPYFDTEDEAWENAQECYGEH